MISMWQLIAVGLLLMVVTHFVTYAVGHHEGVTLERDRSAQERAVSMALAQQAAAEARAAGERFGAALARRDAEIKAAATSRAGKASAAASTTVACLTPAVVGALNDDPAAGSTSEAAAAAWIANAQQQHEQCREQVINLGQWISTVTKKDDSHD